MARASYYDQHYGASREKMGAFVAELRAIANLPVEQGREALLERIAALTPIEKALRQRRRDLARQANIAKLEHFDANWELRTLRQSLFRLARYVAEGQGKS